MPQLQIFVVSTRAAARRRCLGALPRHINCCTRPAGTVIQTKFTELLDKPGREVPVPAPVTFKSVTSKRFLHARPVVLVVDDDIDTRIINRAYLRSRGCRVLTAVDGEQGTAKALRFRPDVIVMDLAMPKLDGWAATRLLRRRKATARTPIIALSAVPMARDSARAAGCDAYIAKPCLPDLLWWEICVVLQDRGVMWSEMVRARPRRSKRRPNLA